jgi:hypothetical protein
MKMARAKRVVKELDHVMFKGIVLRCGMFLRDDETGTKYVVTDIREDEHGAYIHLSAPSGKGYVVPSEAWAELEVTVVE